MLHPCCACCRVSFLPSKGGGAFHLCDYLAMQCIHPRLTARGVSGAVCLDIIDPALQPVFEVSVAMLGAYLGGLRDVVVLRLLWYLRHVQITAEQVPGSW